MTRTSLLTDGHGRDINYLRVSVTPRCNLRCQYCLPDGSPPVSPEALNTEELTRLTAQFIELGVSHIRLTGGEPLVRRDLTTLVGNIANLPGVKDLSMTTNGVLLARQADALVRAGLRRVNISLDSLNAQRLERIAGGPVLDRIIQSLDAADAAGLGPIKLNMVVIRDINDDEVEAMAEFCAERGYILRLIEPMPMGDIYTRPADISASLARMQQRFDLQETSLNGGGPARYWQSRDGRLKLGLITPLSQHFCGNCNRVRLTATGTLYTCLDGNDGVELGAMLRDGAGNSELREAIIDAVRHKPGHHTFNLKPVQRRRLMSVTGG
jgi:GTP 3',8-cyclase